MGAAALTRNEAVWLALTWAWLAWRLRDTTRAERLRLIGVVAVISLLVFAPWAARNWAVFGSPLPGQTAANALSITGEDVFAWNDPPTLARYLAVGPAELIGMRVVGIGHNLLNVLVLLGIPLAVIGLLALPWQARDRALRPVAILGATTFLVTSLVFPVSTTWGTFLHAAAPVHVLLVVSRARGARRGLRAAVGADGLDAPGRVARRRARRRRLPAVLRRPAARLGGERPRDGAPLRGPGARARGAGPAARRRDAGDPRLPDLARGDRARPDARPARTRRPRTSSTSRPTRGSAPGC